ncbi:MAG: hypothetical protein JXB36_15925 [Gammaproteobacteria bacterium]|nr:hypothetical protein [Gammaproteobacteria bacterium]
MRKPVSLPAAAAFTGAALSLLACPASTFAQSNALQQRLENATRIECSFGVIATGTWEDAGPTVSVEAAELTAAFFDIDVGGGTAEAEGPYGNSFIVVRYAEGYLHFMQMAHAGPLHLTTVLAQESTDGRMKAVHTRHEYSPTVLPGFTSRPEMYVGDCAVSSGE